MPALKCSVTEYEGHTVVELGIGSIIQTCAPNGSGRYKEYKESIVRNGLWWPILVVQCTVAELKEKKSVYKKSMLELPDSLPADDTYVYVTWGGNNRLVAAKELGYDAIDCIILTSPTKFMDAATFQCKQRTPPKRGLCNDD